MSSNDYEVLIDTINLKNLKLNNIPLEFTTYFQGVIEIKTYHRLFKGPIYLHTMYAQNLTDLLILIKGISMDETGEICEESNDCNIDVQNEINKTFDTILGKNSAVTFSEMRCPCCYNYTERKTVCNHYLCTACAFKITDKVKRCPICRAIPPPIVLFEQENLQYE